MVRRAFLWLAIPLVLAGPASAQAPAGAAVRGGPPHLLAVEAAGLWQGLDDQMASPLRYKGGGAAAGAAYEGGAGDWWWEARGAWATSRLTSRLEDGHRGYEDGEWVFASALLLRRVRGSAEGLAVRLGPALTVEMGSRRHNYTDADWLNFRNTLVAVQAAGRAELGLARGRLSGTVAIPLVGLAVRKEYSGVVGRSPRLIVSLPPSFLLVRQRVEYRAAVAGPLGARVFIDSTLLRHDHPLELASVSHRLGLSLDWTLGAP